MGNDRAHSVSREGIIERRWEEEVEGAPPGAPFWFQSKKEPSASTGLVKGTRGAASDRRIGRGRGGARRRRLVEELAASGRRPVSRTEELGFTDDPYENAGQAKTNLVQAGLRPLMESHLGMKFTEKLCNRFEMKFSEDTNLCTCSGD